MKFLLAATLLASANAVKVNFVENQDKLQAIMQTDNKAPFPGYDKNSYP